MQSWQRAVRFHLRDTSFFHIQLYCFSFQPILARHDVRLVGIGLELLGSEEFVEKRYLQGGG